MSIQFDAPLVVQRWRRFGHDRAYVKLGDDDLGYRDLSTGEVCCERESDVDAVMAATADMFARADEARRAKEYQPRHSADPFPENAGLLPDRDLAANQPGQAVLLRAQELRSEAPIVSFVARVVGAKTKERAFRVGGEGEEEVARRLARLGDGWRVLHAVPVGDRDSDIDHVVIGPGGVFTINTKKHPGAKVWVGGDCVKVNGSNQHYVRNSRHEASRAAKLLAAAVGTDVPTSGVIAVVGAKLTVGGAPSDVAVLTGSAIVRHLRSRPAVLGDSQIETIFDAARHLSTWQPNTVARQEFTQLA